MGGWEHPASSGDQGSHPDSAIHCLWDLGQPQTPQPKTKGHKTEEPRGKSFQAFVILSYVISKCLLLESPIQDLETVQGMPLGGSQESQRTWVMSAVLGVFSLDHLL